VGWGAGGGSAPPPFPLDMGVNNTFGLTCEQQNSKWGKTKPEAEK